MAGASGVSRSGAPDKPILKASGITAGCLEQLERDLSGIGTGAPCPLLAGLNLTTADVVPEYSIFGGWSGWYMEIVLE